MLRVLQHGRPAVGPAARRASTRDAALSTRACGATILRSCGSGRQLAAPVQRRWLSGTSNQTTDHFARFSLAPSFAIDLKALKVHYQNLQRGFHPDTLSANGITAPHEVAAAQVSL